MLFKELCAEYLEDKYSRLRQTTVDGYKCTINKYLVPSFGEMNIEDIQHDDVQALVDSIATYGAAQKAYKTFRQVFHWSVQKKQIKIWDITQGVDLPHRDFPLQKKILTPKEEKRMLEGIVGQPWEAVILFEATLGLRRCEACGLDWSDVDWRKGRVHIQRGAHYVNGKTVEYPPKTELSDRWLKIPRFALERLRKIRGNRKKGRIRGDLSPIQIAGYYKRYCLKHNLPYVPMTQLRHTWATISLEGGASIEDISVALGHSSIDTCLQHYLQSFNSIVDKTTNAYIKQIEQK